MREKIKRVVCFLFVMLVLAANLPLTARAVDPVSAATIANAFAQAITAYGASNGVSMTFDGVTSGNTSDIGETVHELWKAFRSGQQTADDYDTIAAAIFPGLYSKAVTAGGSAVVAVNIAQQYMPDVDDFWNWLLSGPAEMVKVDNAYQWNVNSSTGDIINPVVFYGSTPFVPYCDISSSESAKYNAGIKLYQNSDIVYALTTPVANFNVFCFLVYSNNTYSSYACSLSSGSIEDTSYRSSDSRYFNSIKSLNFTDSTTGLRYTVINSFSTAPNNIYVPVYSSQSSGLLQAKANFDDGMVTSSVKPYVGDAVARPVPIPDTSDPDYGPLPYIGNLPIPWNDTLFGDGTGSLTDAQSDAISKAVDDSIVANPDKTLETEREATDNPDHPTTDDPPSNDPDDYTVPGLQTIFPFCIPFDVYNFLSALAADPVPPHFTATLQFPAAIGGAQTIDIDFNTPTFNQLASILRTLELLAFIVGLALLTRSMFIRG